MTYSLAEIRKAIIKAAEREWLLSVRDDDAGVPGDRDIITGYFDSNGWRSNLPSYGYKESLGGVAWCGHFQGHIHQQIGRYIEPDVCVPLSLDPDIAHFVLPSTLRVHSPAKWRAAGSPMPTIYTSDGTSPVLFSDGTPQRVYKLADVLVPGVMALIVTREYGDYRDDIGGHFVLITAYDADAGTIDTIEGNARGEFANGGWGEGVIRRRGKSARKITDIRSVIHLDLGHFELTTA